jgi:hypothetical protein
MAQGRVVSNVKVNDISEQPGELVLTRKMLKLPNAEIKVVVL